MSDSATNAPAFTVSELSFALKRTVEDAYGQVRVRGEISGYRGPHGSGHAYFCMKDKDARLDAVVWRTTMQRLRFKPEEGLEVVATGKLTTYPGKSAYQIVVDALEPAGAGALMALLEERRRRLAAEGLFDAARKQLLPAMPRIVGVVTSPTGAVIRDILHRLSDRFPVHVVVWPVRVQGETSAAEVAAAIAGFDALPATGGPVPRPDVVIVARGGGSLEDLWGFNEEVVLRAAAACSLPLVSAIGHETDTTLLDFVADERAPTPTAAAERVVPVRADLLDAVADRGLRLSRGVGRLLERERRALAAAARALPRAEALLALPRQRLDAAALRLPRALVSEAQKKRIAFERVAARLDADSAQRAVDRQRDRLGTLGDRLRRGIDAVQNRAAERRRLLAGRLAPELLQRPLDRLGARFDVAATALQRGHSAGLARRRDRLDAVAGLLRTLGYRSVLDRGFALVRTSGGQAVRAAAAVQGGQRLEIEWADGRVGVVAEGGRGKGAGRTAAMQGDLFG